MTDGGAVDRSNFRWSAFRKYGQERMFLVVSLGVFPFMRALDPEAGGAYSRYMSDATFKIPTPQMLSLVVAAVDAVCDAAGESCGDAYEYMISRVQSMPQSRISATPRHIARMIAKIAGPSPGDAVCDPSCGSAELLVAAADLASEEGSPGGVTLAGYEPDGATARIGAMNMIAHGIADPRIKRENSLSSKNYDADRYDLVLCSSPFGNVPDRDRISQPLLSMAGAMKSDLLYLSLSVRTLRPGGRCAIVVPEDFLASSARAYKAMRKALIEENRLDAVISMPRGVSHPNSIMPTALLVFTKDERGTDAVWFYRMEGDGLRHGIPGRSPPDNDIPDIIERFKRREGERGRRRQEKSFMVPKPEIADNDYILSPAMYAEPECPERAHRPSAEVLDEMIGMSERLVAELKDLRRML